MYLGRKMYLVISKGMRLMLSYNYSVNTALIAVVLVLNNTK